jgi:hypothetical protein
MRHDNTGRPLPWISRLHSARHARPNREPRRRPTSVCRAAFLVSCRVILVVRRALLVRVDAIFGADDGIVIGGSEGESTHVEADLIRGGNREQ